MPNSLSVEAQVSIACARAYRARAERQLARMVKGPHVQGSTIIIPSEWYDKNAANFWRSIGAVWCPGHPDGQAWILHHDRTKYAGRTWTAEQWLESITRKYREYWPELERRNYCVSCGQEFVPWHPKQRWCPDCTS